MRKSVVNEREGKPEYKEREGMIKTPKGKC